MTTKNEIEVLKAKVRAIKSRLHSLNTRISEIEQGFPSSTLKAFVDQNTCVGCGICRDVCPAGAIAVEEVAIVDPKRCTGCGHCVEQCPSGAIILHSEQVL